MTALGTKRTTRVATLMSANDPKADASLHSIGSSGAAKQFERMLLKEVDCWSTE